MVATVASFHSFVGVDLHLSTVTLAAVDPAGQTPRRLTCATRCVRRIDEYLDALPWPVHLAVEACPFVEWFIGRFRDRVRRMDIADATALAALRGKRRKTDRNGAMDIAVRLARGDCPLGWIADEPVAQLRKLGRHWRALSRILSRSKHGLRSMLHAAHLRGPTPGKLDGAAARRWLLAHGHPLKGVAWQAFADFVDLIQLLERQRERLRRQIIVANRDKRFAAMIAILQSVPGIKDIWSAVIAAMVRKLLRLLYALMRDGATYRISEPTNHQAKANHARLKRVRQRQAVEVAMA